MGGGDILSEGFLHFKSVGQELEKDFASKT